MRSETSQDISQHRIIMCGVMPLALSADRLNQSSLHYLRACTHSTFYPLRSWKGRALSRKWEWACTFRVWYTHKLSACASVHPHCLPADCREHDRQLPFVLQPSCHVSTWIHLLSFLTFLSFSVSHPVPPTTARQQVLLFQCCVLYHIHVPFICWLYFKFISKKHLYSPYLRCQSHLTTNIFERQ